MMTQNGPFGLKARRTLAAATVLLVASCASGPDNPLHPTAAPAASQGSADISPQMETRFEGFLRDFRVQALAAGIDGGLYDRALGQVRLNPRIEQLNAAQPEFSKPVWEYLDSAVSAARIADGKAALLANAALFDRLEAAYGIPRQIIAAIWANESNYGRFMGSFNLFEALATLAFEGPRTAYARPQLLAALKVAQSGPFDPTQMKSSWAGAFGQTQFIPTSYLAHAVDFDGDGKKDVWTSPGDALASAAQLLANAGWQRGEVWGVEVKLPPGFAYEDADLDIIKPMAEWRARGVTTVAGASLDGDQPGAIILPGGARGPAFLVFNNFRVVLKYNAAVSYGLAVCLLADRLVGGNGIVAPWPRAEQALSRSQRFQLQQDLKTLGYDPGSIDGVIGRQVRAAIRDYQKSRNIAADGFATVSLLAQVAGDAGGR